MEDVWDLVNERSQALIRKELPKRERVKGEPHLESLREFVHLADQAKAIRDCDADWQTKHEVIFSTIQKQVGATGVSYSNRWEHWEALTGGCADEVLREQRCIECYVKVLEEKAEEVRKVLAALDGLTRGA